MDNLDDSENNAKVSDSAYSNSCSNSQSRRSHSSKSTHSGSHSSGSSGYGGKPSTSGYSSNNLSQPPEKRIKEKESKKKKPAQVELKITEVKNEVDNTPAPIQVLEEAKEKTCDVIRTPPPMLVQVEKVQDNMEINTSDRNSGKDEPGSGNTPLVVSNYVTSRPNSLKSSDGFSCVISMHDGVVMYTTTSITTTLGFPKDMWIGRSFIDFVHPRDRDTFASQITNGLAVPKKVNCTQEKATIPGNHVSTMVCRIRRYRGFSSGFGIKDRVVTFMPFLLKFFFKNINDEEGQVIYLVIQATPFFSAFKTSNEVLSNAIPFVIRHSANGSLEYIDPESVPYLGYLPQDIVEQDALKLYHPSDLGYLRQIYETIVKEGGVTRSKPYRMMAQNGDYLKLETEWSSFINPWSKKLEFVIGKHFIIEGPTNPDVFQSPDPEKAVKLSEDEKAKVEGLKENITRIMNEVLTKPAEVAKQQMSKRCQDLASFMESLLEETPKTDEELRLEIQDPDHSYYERDSVMLGGISPHHDYNDGKSSTETPVSYNQLNYNENLQRYFDSHEPYSFEDCLALEENKLDKKEPEAAPSKSSSPIAQNSSDFAEWTSSGKSSGIVLASNSSVPPLGDYQPVRLTENLLNKETTSSIESRAVVLAVNSLSSLNTPVGLTKTLLHKHNAEMEKELVKMHRESRSGKGEREKVSETRQKKKEHLARCNASFQPTTAGLPTIDSQIQPHGIKRASKQTEEAVAHKHRCSSPRLARRRQTNNTGAVQTTSATTVGMPPVWPTSSINNMNTFFLGVGIPQQMSILSPMAVPGVIPMCYAPATTQAIHTTANANTLNPGNVNPQQYQGHALPCMMYSQAVYGSPFVYPSVDPQARAYSVQQHLMQNMYPLGLSSSNYEEESSGVDDNQRANKEFAVYSSDIRSSYSISLKSTEARREEQNKLKARIGNIEGTVDKTDEESSYSSFYSSFFKTESGSAEESDAKKINNKYDHRRSTEVATYPHDNQAKVARRKMEPPWMEQVCVTSELIYKYQILSKNVEDVLSVDKQRLQNFEQPNLVNEQLGQLYLDLQLEGVAARLTLEEGITSSSSSGEETSARSSKGRRRKREYSKLVMIYEEDAPLPPPEDAASSSTS